MYLSGDNVALRQLPVRWKCGGRHRQVSSVVSRLVGRTCECIPSSRTESWGGRRALSLCSPVAWWWWWCRPANICIYI